MLLKLIAAISMLIDHIDTILARPRICISPWRSRAAGIPHLCFLHCSRLSPHQSSGSLFPQADLLCSSKRNHHPYHDLAYYASYGTNVLFTFVAAWVSSPVDLLTSSWRDRVARLQPLTNYCGSQEKRLFPDPLHARELPPPCARYGSRYQRQIISLCAAIYLDSDYGSTASSPSSSSIWSKTSTVMTPI